MRVNRKGQVTIPKGIRERLGIGPGTELDVKGHGDEVRLLPVRPVLSPEERLRQFHEWADRVAGTIDLGGMTVDEYMEMLRGPHEDFDPS